MLILGLVFSCPPGCCGWSSNLVGLEEQPVHYGGNPATVASRTEAKPLSEHRAKFDKIKDAHWADFIVESWRSGRL